MFLFSLSFLLGVLLVQEYSELPKLFLVSEILLMILILKIIFPTFSSLLKILFAGSLGFFWCLLYIHFHTTWMLTDKIEGKDCLVTGYIASIPIREEHRTTFLFALKTVSHESAQGLVHLSWQKAFVQLRAGDEWQFMVRLKKIHSTRNPGGFDHEAFYFQEGIRATGYVVDRNNLQISNHFHFYYLIPRIRQYLRDLIMAALIPSHTSPWITALAIGVREGIHSEDWEVLRNTGTNHLMAIAGLHIGFISGFVFSIVSYIWRLLPYLPLIMPAENAASLSALFMALLYSAMAGFSIPTERACIMISIILITVFMRRNVSAWYAWSLALLSVLMINPLSVLTDSFWLSFYSVALIIYGMGGRLSPHGLWWQHGRIQWVISVGLIPLSIWLFRECSLVSFIANSIAIPIVGFLVVPLTLLGTFSLLISSKYVFFLQWADCILQWLWKLLTFFSKWSWSYFNVVIPEWWMLISACFGVTILLIPRGLAGRWLGLIFILPFLLYKPAGLLSGQVKFTLLDVGQGLSAVIQTRTHALLFDAGARLSETYDMGESVVLPYLQSQGIQKLNMMIVSHGDNDHSGGVKAILKKIPVMQIKTSVPGLFSNADTCLQGEYWKWDDVRFEFIYPDQDSLGLGNDSSCVLRVTTGKHHILLTGDIEKRAEKKLLDQEISADILVAPHHGSKTSGSEAFIDAVHPRVVLFPIGYRNRYHFPHASVVMKYQERGIQMYDSVKSGALQFILDDRSEIEQPLQYRVLQKRYWNHY